MPVCPRRSIRAVQTWGTARPSPTPTTTGGDETCWEFCRRLLDREKVDDELYATAKARFGEAGVADLVHTCGFYSLVSMTLNTFEVALPDGVSPPFPAS